MSSFTRTTTLVLIVMCSGCGGTQENSTSTPTPPPENDVEPSDASVEEESFFVQSEAVAASEEAAYTTAVDQLEVALFGEEPWVAALGLPSHDPARDPMRRSEGEGGNVRVIVGMERERVVELLGAISELPLEATLPEPLREPVEQHYEQHLRRFVCSRRQALLSEACDPPPPDDDLAARFRELSLTLRIQPVYQGGIPLDAAGHPLRALAVKAEIATETGEWVPLPGLPVAAVLPDGATGLETTEATSDPDGMVRFPFGEGSVWPEGVRVDLDRARLLGPLAELWPPMEVPMTSRRISSRRWGLVSTVRVQGRSASGSHFASGLQRALGQRGLKARFTVPFDVSQRLRALTPNQLTTALPRLADTWVGRVDVLIRVELDSEYASPMGDHRMWYEAQGQVEAFDVWTGRRIASFETSTTASGVGHERADRTAQTRFANQVAELLVAELPQGP